MSIESEINDSKAEADPISSGVKVSGPFGDVATC